MNMKSWWLLLLPVHVLHVRMDRLLLLSISRHIPVCRDGCVWGHVEQWIQDRGVGKGGGGSGGRVEIRMHLIGRGALKFFRFFSIL